MKNSQLDKINNIIVLLKIILANRDDFNNKKISDKRDNVFKLVLEKGQELKYFSDDYDIKKVKEIFWKHQLKKFKQVVETCKNDFSLLSHQQALVYEIINGKKVPIPDKNVIESQDSEASDDAELLSSQHGESCVLPGTSESSGSSGSSGVSKKRKIVSFKEAFDKKKLLKIDLEIEGQKIRNYIERLNATNLEKSLNIKESEFTVKQALLEVHVQEEDSD